MQVATTVLDLAYAQGALDAAFLTRDSTSREGIVERGSRFIHITTNNYLKRGKTYPTNRTTADAGNENNVI